MNREQPHRVRPLLLGNRLELARADRFLLGDEPDEAFDIWPAQLLVGARKPRELAHVRVPSATVPLCEHREVIVVLAHDLLAQPFERQARHRVDEAVEALPERAQQACVPAVERGRQRMLDPAEERPPRRGAPDERKPVVRDPDERRREHGKQRRIVVTVVQQPQVREQVDDLLLPEVALPGRAVCR